MNLRLTSDLRAELQRLADEDGRKLSAYIERLLQLHVRGSKSTLVSQLASPHDSAERNDPGRQAPPAPLAGTGKELGFSEDDPATYGVPEPQKHPRKKRD